ncbi:zinc finger protein 771-like [Hippocampus zosterae]|uniref:zinc finger protein 771-like n=1 Tax=Hippocampus zosterae TaxID=109293 RepID=UPI00223DA996|nr:zinc finger protein 771-like [Hippocampus zosterae]
MQRTAYYEDDFFGGKEDNDAVLEKSRVGWTRAGLVTNDFENLSKNVCTGWQEPESPHIKKEVDDEEHPCIQEKEETDPLLIKKEYKGHTRIKEKEELLQTKGDEEKLLYIKAEDEEQNVCKLSLTAIPLKSEDEGQSEASRGVGPPGSSSCHHVTSESDGGSFADGLSAPPSGGEDMTPCSTETDAKAYEGDMTCETDKRWKCSQCGKTYACASSLKRHVICHCIEKPYPCSLCGRRFSQKGTLKIHMKTHTSEKSFACSVCNQIFFDKGQLKIHTRTHTGEKPFACSVCGQRFSRKGHLKIHSRIHTGEKPFPCSVCGQRFSEKGVLKSHTRTHTGEKPFTCLVCGQRFSQRGSLKFVDKDSRRREA